MSMLIGTSSVVRGVLAGLMVLFLGLGSAATAQIVVDGDVAGAAKRKTIVRELTLEVDPFGGEFTQWLQAVEFSDYTAGYTFRWKLRGSPYSAGEYIVRDQSGAVVRRGGLQMAGRQQGFFNLSLKDLPQRSSYTVTVQGIENGQPSGDPSTPVSLTFVEYELAPFAFASIGFENTINQLNVPGMSAAISCSPTHFQEWSVGVRRLDSPVKVQNGDLWHIGSNTKAMTAVMIVKLIDEGHFDWDTSVWDLVHQYKLLPGWDAPFPPLFSPVEQSFRDVTIDRLAAHRSGMIMPAFYNDPTRELENYSKNSMTYRGAIVRGMLEETHNGIIGEWRYGQGNFMFLGHLIERVRGKPYEQVIREELWEPLGMTTAKFGMPTDAGFFGNPNLNLPTGSPWSSGFPTMALNVNTTASVNGHRYDKDEPEGQRTTKNNLALPPVWNPAGGAYMSSADYLKFGRALTDGTFGDFTLSQASRDLIRTIYTRSDRAVGPFDAPEARQADPAYGWAWSQWTDDTGEGFGQVLGHDGSYNRFHSTARVYLDEGFVVVATANQGGEEAPAISAVSSSRNYLVEQGREHCAAIRKTIVNPPLDKMPLQQ
ncbi:MAG: beta-lactamase family protein, partial [Parvularculaceae bacterium]|nr:beta-lactamase family protein [Parvularculaceae bacterium]